MGEPRLTWGELVKREPRLRSLCCFARDLVKPEGKPFCANAVWDAVFEPQFEQLVGWFAQVQDGVVNTQEAYDLAFERIYEALPDCDHEGLCWTVRGAL
jgi:hypothetical protein